MVGALTEWRDPFGTQLTAGVGEPGVYTGIYVPGFRRLGGTMTTAGGQWALNRNWSAGLQYYGAHDVTSPLQPEDDAQQFSSRSWFGSTAWQDATTAFSSMRSTATTAFDGNAPGRLGRCATSRTVALGTASASSTLGRRSPGAISRSAATRAALITASTTAAASGCGMHTIDYTAPLADSDSIRHDLRFGQHALPGLAGPRGRRRWQCSLSTERRVVRVRFVENTFPC